VPKIILRVRTAHGPRGRARQGSQEVLVGTVLSRIGAVTAVLAIARVTSAQGTPDTLAAARQSVLRVTVTTNGTGVVGAQVQLAGGRVVALTNESGAFQIAGLPAGPSTLVVRRLGFRAETLSVAGPFSAATPPIQVRLTEVAQQLTAMTVTARARPRAGPLGDFDRRRAHAIGGHFITREDIVELRPHKVTDLLRRVPNFSLSRRGLAGAGLNLRDNHNMDLIPCEPLVWIDGVPVAGRGFVDIDALSPDALEGMEIYSGLATVPPELLGPQGEGACGVLAIWTRHGEPTPQRRVPASVASERLREQLGAGHVFTADQVDERAHPTGDVSGEPVYPDSLKRQMVRGRVLAEFVVDTTGSVEPETVTIVTSTLPPFGSAVQDALPAARFTPGRIASRPVRQLVQMVFQFEPEARASGVGVRATP
jgi:TonB family protein